MCTLGDCFVFFCIIFTKVHLNFWDPWSNTIKILNILYYYIGPNVSSTLAFVHLNFDVLSLMAKDVLCDNTCRIQQQSLHHLTIWMFRTLKGWIMRTVTVTETKKPKTYKTASNKPNSWQPKGQLKQNNQKNWDSLPYFPPPSPTESVHSFVTFLWKASLKVSVDALACRKKYQSLTTDSFKSSNVSTSQN